MIKHLVQPFGAPRRLDAYPALLLPRVVVVLELFDELFVYLVGGGCFELFGRVLQFQLRLDRLDLAVFEIPERRIDVMPVADKRYDRNAEKLCKFAEIVGQDGVRSA